MNPVIKNDIAEAQQKDRNSTLIKRIDTRAKKAKARRSNWESIWQECSDYALPQRDVFGFDQHSGARRTDHLFDATALDSVDQLSASLLSELTPPWTSWFGFKPGMGLSPEQAEAISPALEDAARVMQSHFDKANFNVEMHQCFLDLVTLGTASLYFEEAVPGSFSAFKFTAIPLSQVVLEEGPTGRLEGTFRASEQNVSQLISRFGRSALPAGVFEKAGDDQDRAFKLMEAVVPNELKYEYVAYLEEFPAEEAIITQGVFPNTPFINFRWLKIPGEIYGRSPVMKALPDIKTANKVVELVLKNASISVTGIWQADDDGVLNLANIDLTPGSIIPRAVGSRGLTPLEMPSRFDVSEIVLSDLRGRIRHALLSDRLGQIGGSRMTATEVLERSTEMARLLGATYGRLQSELLTPLIKRAYDILRRRGEIPDLALDGRIVELDYRSPLARAQSQRSVQNTLNWAQTVLGMGAEASEAIDLPATARYLGRSLGVPSDLIREELSQPPVAPIQDPLTPQEGDTQNVDLNAV